MQNYCISLIGHWPIGPGNVCCWPTSDMKAQLRSSTNVIVLCSSVLAQLSVNIVWISYIFRHLANHLWKIANLLYYCCSYHHHATELRYLSEFRFRLIWILKARTRITVTCDGKRFMIYRIYTAVSTQTSCSMPVWRRDGRTAYCDSIFIPDFVMVYGQSPLVNCPPVRCPVFCHPGQ